MRIGNSYLDVMRCGVVLYGVPRTEYSHGGTHPGAGAANAAYLLLTEYGVLCINYGTTCTLVFLEVNWKHLRYCGVSVVMDTPYRVHNKQTWSSTPYEYHDRAPLASGAACWHTPRETWDAPIWLAVVSALITNSVCTSIIIIIIMLPSTAGPLAQGASYPGGGGSWRGPWRCL